MAFCCCSFLLELSLLDLACSGYTASKLAASALSVALAVFGKPEWPAALQQFGSYTGEDLAACKASLRQLQAAQVSCGQGCYLLLLHMVYAHVVACELDWWVVACGCLAAECAACHLVTERSCEAVRRACPGNRQSQASPCKLVGVVVLCAGG